VKREWEMFLMRDEIYQWNVGMKRERAVDMYYDDRMKEK